MFLTLDQMVARSGGCISADLTGSVAILHPESGLYFGLNEVGASVWNLLREPRLGHDILAALLAEYDVEPAVCRADLLALLDRLEEQKLICVQKGAPLHAPAHSM